MGRAGSACPESIMIKDQIEVDVWEPNSEKPGYLRFVRMRTLGEVFSDLKARLEAEGLLPDEYFSVSLSYRYMEKYRGMKENEIPIPQDYWRIICFAVTGTSEGHYIHVGAVIRDGTYQNLFLGKTFQGMDFAQRVTAACATWLS